MYSIIVYIPSSHLDQVKEAMFEAGAGKIGQYDRCCWQVVGEGQFRPLAQSNPYTGDEGEQNSVSEYRVEMICDLDHVAAVIRAMQDAHPYETPAYHYFEVHP